MKKNTTKDIYVEIFDWLKIYHESVDIKERQKAKALIVTRMFPIVRRIACTIARRSYDPVEDLMQAGFIGLLKAIDKFKPNINDNFKVYAGYLIIGEMKHYLRDQSKTIRVPAYIQELTVRIHNFIRDLTVEQMEALTNVEVAKALNIKPDVVSFTLEVERRCNTVSLDELQYGSETFMNFEEYFMKDDYKENLKYEDLRILFKKVLDKLPADEKNFIEMYYYLGMQKQEIAKSLELTKMQVTRKMQLIFNHIADLFVKEFEESDIDKGCL